MGHTAFWEPRKCFLAPIKEIFIAADLLNTAVNEHLAGNSDQAKQLIIQADMPIIAQWTEALWGKKSRNIHRFRKVETLLPLLPEKTRLKERMPKITDKRKLIARDGYQCQFCGIPVIREEVRTSIKKVYPEAVRWGRKNNEQHAAFQCMWLTYEHIVPHSHGGDNSLSNMIVSCQPCNCAKMEGTLEEYGLIDPRKHSVASFPWDGLERFKTSTESD